MKQLTEEEYKKLWWETLRFESGDNYQGMALSEIIDLNKSYQSSLAAAKDGEFIKISTVEEFILLIKNTYQQETIFRQAMIDKCTEYIDKIIQEKTLR